MGKNTSKAPTLSRIRYMCFNLTLRSRCNSSSRCCYRVHEHVDPTWSRKIRCSGDNHPETPSSPGSVGLARAHPLTKPRLWSLPRQTRSSYGPPYPLGRWPSGRFKHIAQNLSSIQCPPISGDRPCNLAHVFHERLPTRCRFCFFAR